MFVYSLSKIIETSSFESSENTQKKESGSYCAISDNEPYLTG